MTNKKMEVNGSGVIWEMSPNFHGGFAVANWFRYRINSEINISTFYRWKSKLQHTQCDNKMLGLGTNTSMPRTWFEPANLLL